MSNPLEGVKVIELANFIAAATAGRFMADLGADVIKIESPKGDPLRYTAPSEGRPLDMKAPGVSCGKPEDKMGVVGCATSDIILDNVIVPESDRLGEEGDGFKIAMKTLNTGRLGVAAQSIGVAQGCLDEAIKYAKERKQFGKRIADFQAIAFMIADMGCSFRNLRRA